MQNLHMIDSIVSHDVAATKAQYEALVELFLANCRMRNLSPVAIEGYHIYLKQFQRDLENLQQSPTTCTSKAWLVRTHGE